MFDLKIGRNIYTITDKDEFMDNGNCVQLLTQSKELSQWGRRSNPVLSKKTIKEIEKYKKTFIDHAYRSKVYVFRLSSIL